MIDDEYDLQYVFGALLALASDDVRPEEWTPSYAGGSARVDFLLKDENVVLELKRTRDGRREVAAARSPPAATRAAPSAQVGLASEGDEPAVFDQPRRASCPAANYYVGNEGPAPLYGPAPRSDRVPPRRAKSGSPRTRFSLANRRVNRGRATLVKPLPSASSNWFSRRAAG
jgi:REase_DpnII-MboI